MGNDGLGKAAEAKIREWLDRPDFGYSFDRIPDQLSGMYGSKNICDFTLFKYPEYWYIESKATWDARFSFDMITSYQLENMLKKSDIPHVHSIIIILFATQKRAFIIDIREIDKLLRRGIKSININKLQKWCELFKYVEIDTVPNNRKKLLDYTGEIDEYLNKIDN
jgi:hypothetical protein